MKKHLLGIFVLFLYLSQGNAQTNLLSEDFSSASGSTPPSGWSINQLYTIYSSDVFRFDNPGSRTAYSPISGKFAIFDSDNYSNNGAFENIALESPAFSANGIPNLSLSFTYQFGAQIAFGYIEVFDGNTWNLLGTITTPTGTSSDSASVDISKFCGNVCNAKVRFRWSSNSGGYWAIDNVKVSYKGNKDSLDAAVFNISSPVSGSCGNPNAKVEVILKNNGTKPIGNYPVFLEVFDGTSTTQLTDTSKVQIVSCSTTKLTFSNTIDISDVSKTYTFKAYTVLSGDQYAGNDTFRINNFKVQTAPKQPDADTFLVCNNTNVKVNITPNSGDQTFWFTTISGGTPFLKDNSFFTNTYQLTKDTVLYVETFRSKNDTIPKPYSIPSTAGFNAGNATGYWLTITAKTDIVIDSFSILFRDNAGTNGNCSLYYKTGTQTGFESSPGSWKSAGTASIVSKGSTALAFLKLGGVKIATGQTITFYISSTMSMEFSQSSLNISNNSMEVSASSVHLGPAFTMYQILNNFSFPGTIFYSVPCLSSRVPILIDFEQRPQSGFIAGSLFQGTYSPTYPKLYDAAEVGDTLLYEITPPVGYTNSDYGTKWLINNIEVGTKSGTPVSDTLTSLPNGTDAATFRFIATSNYRDSIIVIRYGIEIIGFCDTVIQRHISIAPKPVPSFTVSGPCVNFVTNFINTSTIVTGSMTYQWDFGDGNTASVENPHHAYSSKGIYKVKLIATSNLGFADSVIRTLEIVDVPVADFSFKNACEGETVSLKDASQYSGAEVKYIWSFSDGSPSVVDSLGMVDKMFFQAGTYIVTLRINVDGCYNEISKNVEYYEKAKTVFAVEPLECDSLKVIFTNMTTEPQTGSVSYKWDFGDGKSGSSKDETHYFDSVNSYNVILYSITDHNCIDSFTEQVALLEAAKLDISFIGQECTNSANSFTNNTKTPAGYTILYNWDFGDGGTSTFANPSHSFKTAGQYQVYINAFVTNGCVSEKYINLDIKEKPIAAYVINKNSVCIDDTVNAVNQTSYSGSGLNYTWVFDGQEYTDKDIKVSSKTSGVFYLKLISEANSCKDSISKTIIVNPEPVSTFSANTTQSGDGTFSIVPTVPNNGSYKWTFDDGSADASNASGFIRQFAKQGNIEICLYRKDNNTCEAFSCSTINVNTSSVNSFLKNSLKIYPNPANDYVVFENPTSSDEPMELNIINTLGEMVTLDKIVFLNEKYRLSTIELPAGIYIIKLKNHSAEYSSRMIIIR